MPRTSFESRKKVFIVSTGRTGTQFFWKTLPDIISECYAIHEPDKTLMGKNCLKYIRGHGGFANLLFLKALGLTGARNLSLRRLSGQISKSQLLKQFCGERRWTERLDCELYVEPNQQMYGFSEDLLELPNVKIAYFVRNPVTWIPSMLNYSSGWYGKNDVLDRIGVMGFRRLTPKLVKQNTVEWHRLGQVEKLAWLWLYVNGLFKKACDAGHPNARLYRYEDFFIEKHDETIKDFLLFIGVNAGDVEGSFQSLKERLGRKVDFTTKTSVKRSLTDSETDMVHNTCGELMQGFGYE